MQHPWNHRIFLVLFMFFAFMECYPQTPFLKQIPLFRGREDYTVNVIYQDQKGWIWFGTDKGLFRYDGINHTRYTVADSLASDNITAMMADPAGIMWIGHRNGRISKFDGNNFGIFRPEEGLGQVEITDISVDKESNIWYSTLGEGIFRYDGRHLSNVNSDDGISDNYVYDIEFDPEGTMWLATDYGITRYTSDSCDVISMSDGLPDNIVRVLKSDSEGRIWLGTEDEGISIYNPEDLSIIQIGGWHFGTVTGLTLSLGNELWISTDRQGIIKINFESNFTDPAYQQITTSQGLISDRLNSILKDSENNIWIGGKTGVIQALPPLFEFLNKSTGTPFEMVYSFTFDMDGNYWLCSESGLYKGIPGESGQLVWKNISLSLHLEDRNFISIYLDSKGYIWTGTYGSGVYRIGSSGSNYEHYDSSLGLSDNNVIFISGNDSLVWFSTLGGGISGFNLKKDKIFNISDENLEQSYIYSAIQDGKGRTWIAGSLKYIAYLEKGVVHFIQDSTLNLQQLYGIAVDTTGKVWFNANEHGIICVQDQSLVTYGKEEGIDFDEIQSIVFDRFNNLVIISNQGIKFYREGSGVFMEFGENTGLAYQYPLLNSVYTDRNGQIWIGTETGIIKYNPDYLSWMDDQPRIFLSTVSLFSEPVKKGKQKYRYKENNFTFGYTGLWFKNPEALNYRYILEGYDINWTYTRRSEPFTYSKLPNGKFKFVAQVSLDNKNWFDSPDSVFAFEVLPPFWKRLWFIFTSVLILIAGIYIYIRMRLANLQRAKEELEEEVSRRTEEIRAQNEELETQKEEIAAQRDLAEHQRDQIEQQKEEIQASIRYAHRIQSAALPPKAYLDSILGDYFILNKPRDIVSGDFYWVARNESHVFFSVGDCTGHGVPGAFMSMLGLTALNDIVKSLDQCKASNILDKLRLRIQESLHQGEKHEFTASDGMDISLCIYEPSTRKLQFAAAHNPLYIIQKGEINVIPADRVGIGSYTREMKEFTNHELTLKRGDRLYLFTDGFPDQFGGPKGKKYKYQRFRELLHRIHQEPMHRQKWLLDEELESWSLGYPKVDDIMIMGVVVD